MRGRGLGKPSVPYTTSSYDKNKDTLVLSGVPSVSPVSSSILTILSSTMIKTKKRAFKHCRVKHIIRAVLGAAEGEDDATLVFRSFVG